ncbi:MAG: hypothetical protein ABFC89_10900 [Methanospirillum sp.]
MVQGPAADLEERPVHPEESCVPVPERDPVLGAIPYRVRKLALPVVIAVRDSERTRNER